MAAFNSTVVNNYTMINTNNVTLTSTESQTNADILSTATGELFNNINNQITNQGGGAEFSPTQILHMLFGVVGILINGLTVMVILKSKKLRENLTNHFLVNQSIIDLVASVGLLATIPIISGRFGGFYGASGYIRCLFFKPLVLVWAPLLASSYNLSALAIEKWYQITRPIQHKKNFSSRKAYMMMAAAWVVGFTYITVRTIAMQTITDRGRCTQYQFWKQPVVRKVNGTFNFTMKYLAPIVIMLYCYGAMIVSLALKPSTVKSDQHNQKMKKAQRNIFLTLVGVVMCFICCVSYNQFLFLLYNLSLHKINFTSFSYHLSVSLYYLNCFVYPFVYLIKYPEFRASFYRLFRIKSKVGPAASTTGTTSY